MLKQRYDYILRKTGTQLGCRFKGTNQPRSLHDALDDDSHHGARRLAPTNPGERPQRRGLFRNRVLYTEALEPPASNATMARTNRRRAASAARPRQSPSETDGIAAMSASSSSSGATRRGRSTVGTAV